MAGDDCSLARAAVARMWLVHRDDDLDAVGKANAFGVAASQRCADPAVLSSALDGQSSMALHSLLVGDARAIIAERLRITEGFGTGGTHAGPWKRIDALYMACELSCLMGEFEHDAVSGAGNWTSWLGGGAFSTGGLPWRRGANFFLGRFDECVAQASGVYGEGPKRHEVRVAHLVTCLLTQGRFAGTGAKKKRRTAGSHAPRR